MNFAGIELNDNLKKGIEELGFKEWTSVQEKTLKYTLSGQDVCVQSKTGTGKTAAFIITIFDLFSKENQFKNKKALVLAPTRELVVQIDKEANIIGKYCNYKTGGFYGGVGYFEQEKNLKNGVNLYVGTPGRLIDFYKSKKINFSQMDIIVIDEADRMFDMGFIKDIQYILRKSKPPQSRLTLLFSATLSTQVKRLSWDLMNQPHTIEIEPEQKTVEQVTQGVYHVSKRDKFKLLLGILKQEKPRNVLIFTNTKMKAENISRRLTANQFPTEFISGDLPQKKRLRLIDEVKSGKISYIVATDVAARGLHIDDLELVINYDLPDDPNSYIHRIGRTARAGKSGKAISLACDEYIYNLIAIETKLGTTIPEIEFGPEMLIDDVGIVTHHKKPYIQHIKPQPFRLESPKIINKLEDKKIIPHSLTTPESGQRFSKPHKYNQIAETNIVKPTQSKHYETPTSNHAFKQKINTMQDPLNELSYDTEKKVSRNLPLKERIALYEKKYGKDFVYKKKHSGFLEKFLGIFKKK